MLGRVTAQETVRLLNGHGQIVIIATAEAASGDSGAALPVTAFRKAIAKSMTVQIRATVTTDAATDPAAAISSKEFFYLLDKYPEANAIVSFVGAPQLTDAEIRQIRSGAPLWVILNEPFPSKLSNLISHDVVQLAVISGPGPAAVPAPKTPEEWFDRYYQFVSQKNLSRLQSQ